MQSMGNGIATPSSATLKNSIFAKMLWVLYWFWLFPSSPWSYDMEDWIWNNLYCQEPNDTRQLVKTQMALSNLSRAEWH